MPRHHADQDGPPAAHGGDDRALDPRVRLLRPLIKHGGAPSPRTWRRVPSRGAGIPSPEDPRPCFAGLHAKATRRFASGRGGALNSPEESSRRWRRMWRVRTWRPHVAVEHVARAAKAGAAARRSRWRRGTSHNTFNDVLRDRRRRERVAERIRGRRARRAARRRCASGVRRRPRTPWRSAPHTEARVLDELRVARLLSGQLGREDHRAAACRALGDGVWTRLADDDRRGRDERERILDEALNAHRGPVGRVRLLEPRLERGVTPADRDDAPAARGDERRARGTQSSTPQPSPPPVTTTSGHRRRGRARARARPRAPCRPPRRRQRARLAARTRPRPLARAAGGRAAACQARRCGRA